MSFLALTACGPSPALEEPHQPMPPSSASAAPSTPSTSPATGDAGAPKPGAGNETNPEEKKKAEARAALEKDRLAMTEANDKEKARWTPELKASAKALTDKSFPTGRTAVEASMASKTRRPGNAERDK